MYVPEGRSGELSNCTCDGTRLARIVARLAVTVLDTPVMVGLPAVSVPVKIWLGINGADTEELRHRAVRDREAAGQRKRAAGVERRGQADVGHVDVSAPTAVGVVKET